jgi:ADP-ribose pyrophosphatase
MSEKITTAFTKKDVEILKRDVLHQGFFCTARYHLRFKLFDGSWSNVILREMMERKSAVGVLPYDPILDRVVLIEQFRPGALSHPVNAWLLEIIAGLFDPHENSESVVKREAQEEAGCNILDLHPICEFFVSPGGSNEYFKLFCGRVDASQAEGIFGLPEENENIRAFSLSREEAYKLIQAGKIQTSPAIIALQWLQIHHAWLRTLWQTNPK